MEGNVTRDFPGVVWEQPRTFLERLKLSEKQPVTVYLRSVHAGPVGSRGWEAGGTLALHGLLAFVGDDYLEVHVPVSGGNVTEVVVPVHAVGAVLPGVPVF